MEQGAEDGIDSVIIESATPEVLDEVWAIEQACFSAPLDAQMLAAELSGNQFAHFLIAKCSDLQSGACVIAGYFCYWIGIRGTWLMNLAVLAPFRRRGVATKLVCAALRAGVSAGRVGPC